MSWLTSWFQSRTETDPILQLRGLGKEIWAGIDGVEYQRSLRADEAYTD